MWKWDKPLHRPLRALLFTKSECVGSLTSHRFITCARACQTGPRVYRPHPGRPESQTVCRCYTKAALYPQLFKDPGCCSRQGLNLRPPAQQTAAVLTLWTDNHYVHQNILKGLLKRNFSTASVGGWKAKLWCYRLIWITHLATIERPWIEKLTGILSGSPLSARIKDGLSNGGPQLLVNTWENEKRNK